MKVAVFLLVLIAFASSAPQPRKDFHEHFEDFVELILQEAGHELYHIIESYAVFEEFNNALEYLKTSSFRDLMKEMESLPEFQAVVNFLEENNIDITFFLDQFYNILDSIPSSRISVRHATGTSLFAFIQDSINAFPQEKLDALFQQKKAEDEAFKNAIDRLFSDAWEAVFKALMETPEFQREAEILMNNGIDINAVMLEIIAVFGQNK